MSPHLPSLPRRTAGSRVASAAAALLLAATLSACGNPERAVRITIERYLGAIQQRHHRAMAVLWAPYRRAVAGMSEAEEARALEDFRQRIDRANAEFETAKQTGSLTPDDLGIGMLRALGIGKGAFAMPLGVQFLEAEGHTIAHARTRILTNLDGLNLDDLPTGVRVYLMGYPFGHLETVAVGYEELKDESLLGSVEVSWSLVKADEAMPSPTGWLIESLSPDPASAVRWEPGRRKP